MDSLSFTTELKCLSLRWRKFSSRFTMSVTIPQFFLTDAGRGNPYMHQHYQDGDDMILKFHCYNRRNMHLWMNLGSTRNGI